MARKHLSTTDLIPRYLGTLACAAVTWAIIAYFAARFLSASRASALLTGEVVALAVLIVTAAVTAARGDRATIERLLRIVLWTAFVAAAAPGLSWLVLWLSAGSAQAFFGLAAVVLGGLPPLAAARWRHRLPAVLGCCLPFSLAALVLWQGLVPFSLAVAVGWAFGLALIGYIAGRRTENVVPSN
ncbi:MAG TPA: hypothetical protein VFG87_08175 [Amycolatopsis sp.]|nr:hypothetical protein [Amycolatopsis sp.]